MISLRLEQIHRPHYVYRHIAPDGELLYVGCTINPDRRPYDNLKLWWWGEVAEVRVDGPMSCYDAFAIEQAVIGLARPRHNQRHDRDLFGSGINSQADLVQHAKCVGPIRKAIRIGSAAAA